MLTTEIEHVDVDAIEAATREAGVDCEPTPSTIRIIQVRVRAMEVVSMSVVGEVLLVSVVQHAARHVQGI